MIRVIYTLDISRRMRAMWPLLGLALLLAGLVAWLLRRRPARVEVTPLAAAPPPSVEQWALKPPETLPESFLAATPRLLPRVRNAAWLALDDLERQVRGFPRSPVPHRVVAGDLVAEVAWNGHAVDEATLARWGAGFDEALHAALDNLGALSGGGFAETADGERGAWAAAWNDGSDGARVLLPELLGTLGLEGTAVAVVPTDGAFIVADLARPRGLQTLVRLAEAAVRSRKAVPVSATFLVRQDGAWAPWEGDRYAATPDVMRRLRETLALRLHARQKFLLEKRSAGTAVPEVREVRFPDCNRLECTWTEGPPTALPAVEAVTLVRADGTRLGEVPWDRLRRVLGDRLAPLGLQPERYLAEAFPSAEDLAALRPI